MLKRGGLLYHFLFWAMVYLLWLILFRSYSVALSKTMTIEFCYLLFITADYYAISYLIVPKFLLSKKYYSFIVSIVLIIGSSAWLRALVAKQMNAHYFHSVVSVDFQTLLVNSVVNISIWVLLITAGKMLLERIRTQQQLESLEKERVKNELDYLKAQINPHSLFNSLNTIYGHIDKSNQVARNILLQFSELLRYQLYDCSEDKVNLDREIDYIRNYIDFQRLRKDERLTVTVTVENNDPTLQIAPLLLLVLIENAFKFVSCFSDRENKIVIDLHTKGNILYSKFINTKEAPVATATTSTGIGIVNLKRRLELLYAGKYTLTTQSTNDIYETNLIIDLS